MASIPNWIKKGREQWEYRGLKRPSFAVIPKEGQESVWDYPRPPKLETDNRTVLVLMNDNVIAETRSAIRVLETASPPTFYIQPSDINNNFIRKATGTSLCEWKGKAEHCDVIVEHKMKPKVGWSYPDPFECFINGERVNPQPGGFYGGWITSEIVGPVKGEIPEASL